mmetsp:Transcript_125525/g.351564  ORF Transcript_125525/g.351564 Transcript_125525/m.351564 type:complete len:257 (+) Transcript_125525:312-1082(+)
MRCRRCGPPARSTSPRLPARTTTPMLQRAQATPVSARSSSRPRASRPYSHSRCATTTAMRGGSRCIRSGTVTSPCKSGGRGRHDADPSGGELLARRPYGQASGRTRIGMRRWTIGWLTCGSSRRSVCRTAPGASPRRCAGCSTTSATPPTPPMSQASSRLPSGRSCSRPIRAADGRMSWAQRSRRARRTQRMRRPSCGGRHDSGWRGTKSAASPWRTLTRCTGGQRRWRSLALTTKPGQNACCPRTWRRRLVKGRR